MFNSGDVGDDKVGMKKAGNIIFWVVVAAVALIALYTVFGGSIGGGGATKDFTLQDVNGKTVKLSDYRGKVVVLNFWATWCPYCVKEMPDLNSLSSKLSEDSNAVVLAVDESESLGTVKMYLSQNGLTLPVLMDYNGKVGDAYNVRALPTTYIIKKDGTVYRSIEGATNEQELLSIINSVK